MTGQEDRLRTQHTMTRKGGKDLAMDEKKPYQIVLRGEWYSTSVKMELTEAELALFKGMQSRTEAYEPNLEVLPYVEGEPEDRYTTYV